MATKKLDLEIAGRVVSVSNPEKLYFREAGLTKIELVNFYVSVAEGALNGVRDRPFVMKRYVDGAEGEFFFQKRAPKGRPEWLRTVVLSFPSGRTAEEVVIDHPAALLWCVNLGCIDLNPHPVRADDLEHPDELRIDLDPVPGVEWEQIRDVALVTREVLDDLGLVGWPKTSGSRGMHVNIRIHRRWTFSEVRKSALAIAREVERRAPAIATSKWWKEERHGVFLDYNQNAKDRTVASAYSVRPTKDARVSTPLAWDEVAGVRPEELTLRTVPARYAAIGDPAARMDEHPCSIEKLLELAREQEQRGLGDAPWPPHYDKGADEPPRVQPSRARRGAKKRSTATASDELRSEPANETAVAKAKSEGVERATGRRRSSMPLLVISKAAQKEDAIGGLERWKARHPDAARHLDVADVLVDSMRGRYTTWTRVRVNLRHVPEELRPPAEPPDPDYDPWHGHRPE
jgi:bifunctional non-homologous end joining protein LigD